MLIPTFHFLAAVAPVSWTLESTSVHSRSKRTETVGGANDEERGKWTEGDKANPFFYRYKEIQFSILVHSNCSFCDGLPPPVGGGSNLH